MRQLFFGICLICVSFSLFNSCTKEEFETGNVNLEFSEDTIIFDTVFTTVGSATQVFIAYNRGDKDVKVSSIRLAGGENSNFRLNVDGLPGKSFTDIQIGAEDSIFIFVEVTVDPNNNAQGDPMIITDSILFTANGFTQDIDLVAWGQDAYFYSAPTNSQIAPFFFLNCNDIWTNDKPHVVYGYAMVDSGCTLTIEEGTNVYFHPGSGIIVCSYGTLIVNGTLQNNVTFQGDRLGEEFKDVPGQWDRIWLSNLNLHTNRISPSAMNSVIKYAVIKNGTIGLLVDTVPDANPNNLTLQLENTIVKNMSSTGVAFRGSRVNAYNCVFANCGAQTANLLLGGNYKFYQCTFANFWDGTREDPSVTLNNYYGNSLRPLDAYFGNCIVYGHNEMELGLDSFPTGNQFAFRFDKSLIRVESTFSTADPNHYTGVLRAGNGGVNDPLFADPDINDYRLDSLSSPAIDYGDQAIITISPLLTNDILGNARITLPDLGAYERR